MVDICTSDSEHTLLRNELNLAWIDMEMTGLDPETDRIIEIASVVTNSMLNIVIEGPVFAIYQNEEILKKMDDWNKKTHNRSGLIDRVRVSTVTEFDAAKLLQEFIAQYIIPGKSPMCGNSICQDRRFMVRWMPNLERFFHHRNLDVSTLKELCRRWQPAIHRKFKRRGMHTALADIYESLNELIYYRNNFLITEVV
ncbi:MAG: oligoribonuclease [Burkholderia sp.]|nr:oligoribonuclease [Burkholderia sp.]